MSGSVQLAQAALTYSSSRLLWWCVGLLVLGFATAVVTIPMVRALAMRLRLTDAVDPTRKIHKEPIPRLGGVAFVAAFLLAVLLVGIFLVEELVTRALLKEWVMMVVASLAMFGLGLWDDLRPVGAKWKLLIQFVICTVAAFGGFHLHALRVGGEAAFHLGWFGIPLTVMWLLLTTNLVNLIDGIDGLAGGVSLFVFVTLTLTALLSIGAPILLVCVVMIGALLGFLVFNFPPARIFMGDGGAYFLGFLIGQVGLAAEHKSTIVAALLVPMLALGLPIIDTTLAVLRRGIRGLPLFMADREHVHHMLLDLGLSPRRVVLALYFVCAMMSLGAVVVLLNQGRGVALALGALFSLMLTAALGLGYIRRDNPWLQISDAFRMRGRTAYVVELCRLLRFEAARTDSVAHFWREFGVALHKAGIATARFEPAVEGLPEMQLGSGESPHDWVQTWPVLAGMDRVGTLTMSVSRSGMDERLFRRQALLFREAFQAGLDRVLRARRQVMQSRGSGVAAGPGGGRA